MSTLLSPIREFFRKGDVLLLSLCLIASGFGLLLYGKTQQYAAILYSLFFPPDCPYMPVIFTEGVIKWTSMTAYLPLVSMVGVLAYCR